jgi:hypothetical protein
MSKASGRKLRATKALPGQFAGIPDRQLSTLRNDYCMHRLRGAAFA